jgi:hypothetical protein
MGARQAARHSAIPNEVQSLEDVCGLQSVRAVRRLLRAAMAFSSNSSWFCVRAMPLVLALGGLALALAGCGGARISATSAERTVCATRATATAIVWDEGQQVHGRINGAAATPLSAFSYPLGLPGEGASSPSQLGVIVVAPDGRHLAVTATVQTSRGTATYPYTVDTMTHAVTRVTLPVYAALLDGVKTESQNPCIVWRFMLSSFVTLESGPSENQAWFRSIVTQFWPLCRARR